MNFKEACSTLGIGATATADEAKKKYRELTKKYHPDVNKESGAEDKFKRINEAYQRFQAGDQPEPQPGWHRGGHSNVPNPFGRQVYYDSENVEVHTTLSFKDSVLGTKLELKFNRQTKCAKCNGQGEAPLDNGCKHCGGRGSVTGKRGNMIFVSTCPTCQGRVKMEKCSECKGDGVQRADVSVHVSVPPGVVDGNILRLQQMGNFTTSFMGMDQYTDAFLHIKVTPSPGLSIQGKDVVSTLKLSLLDAISGCERDVKTIEGSRTIKIPAHARNKDEITISKLGVAGEGDHRVVLDVMYPKDTSNLVKALQEEK